MRSGPQVVIPLYAANILGLDVSAIGMVMSIGSTLDMLLFYPAGVLMDRLGRKFAIVPSLLMMAIGIALVPLTQNISALLAVAMLTGLGNGLSSGALLTLGSDMAPPEGRSEFLGMWTLMGDLGTTTGPLAVGNLADVITLPATAWVIASAGLVGAAIFTFLVPEPVKRRS
jgi:MFS family permease